MSDAANITLGEMDQKHLRLLSLFHYLVGGLQALFSLFPLIHLFLGAFMIFAPESLCPPGSHVSKCMPPFFGYLFVLMAVLFIGVGLVTALGIAANGRFIARRQYWLACIIIAGLECSLFPLGTLLGVFTIVVLTKSSVKAMFQKQEVLST